MRCVLFASGFTLMNRLNGAEMEPSAALQVDSDQAESSFYYCCD